MALGLANTRSLRWQWPADRSPDHKIAVRVAKLREEGRGLFGFRQFPGFTTALPDPMELSGAVEAGPADWLGTTVKLRLPRLEIPQGVGVGSLVGLGLIGTEICICIGKADANSATTAQAWIDSWNCEQ